MNVCVLKEVFACSFVCQSTTSVTLPEVMTHVRCTDICRLKSFSQDLWPFPWL